MTSEKSLCEEPFKSIVFYTSYCLSFISITGLCFVLFEAITKNRKTTLIKECLIIITISELINSGSKLLTIFRELSITSIQIISSIQVIFSIYSDFCSLITSLVISIKIYDLTKKENHIFHSKLAKILSRLFCILVPFIISLIFWTIDQFVFTVQSIEIDEECKVWSWVNRYLSIILYVFLWTIIIIIIVISCKSIAFYNEKKVRINQNEGRESEESEKENNILIDSIISTNADKMKQQIKYFPLVTCVLWGILSIDRISDDLSLIFSFKFSLNNSLLNFKRFLSFMHNFFASIRGIIYCITFFRSDNKLFRDITKLFYCLCCCPKTKTINVNENKKKKAKELLTTTKTKEWLEDNY